MSQKREIFFLNRNRCNYNVKPGRAVASSTRAAPNLPYDGRLACGGDDADDDDGDDDVQVIE